MKRNIIKSFLVAVLCGNLAFSAFAATSLFSNYGQIQNVQKYSSNPFWTPNAPYNQRMPQPVYVQGADLNTEDCMSVVQSLVYVQCAARNNCKGTSLSEIRPTIMVQLSNLPGNNYVSACGGYIDGIFESYVAQFSDSVPNHSVAFPSGTVQNPDVNNTNYQIKNPYKQTVPKWQQEINERAQELKELQEQNAADSSDLSAADFPMTADDLSFVENMANLAAGYTPYKDASAYKPINVTKQQWQGSTPPGNEGEPPNDQDDEPDENDTPDETQDDLTYWIVINGGTDNVCYKDCIGKESTKCFLNWAILYPATNQKYCAYNSPSGQTFVASCSTIETNLSFPQIVDFPKRTVEAIKDTMTSSKVLTFLDANLRNDCKNVSLRIVPFKFDKDGNRLFTGDTEDITISATNESPISNFD